MNSSILVGVARALLDRDVATMAGVWPPACAFLGRQALETAVDEVWLVRRVALGHLPMRAQLLCLGTILDDESLAGAVSHAWWALSRACHHHHYELPPTRDELARWLTVVDELIARTQAVPAM